MVDLEWLGGETEVEGAEELDVLVVRSLEEGDNDVLVRLDLEHLEDQAEELGGATVTSVATTHVSTGYQGVGVKTVVR